MPPREGLGRQMLILALQRKIDGEENPMIIKHDSYPNLYLIMHPLLEDMLTHMRNKNTKDETFARIMDRSAPLIAYEALGDLKLKPEKILTPVAPMNAEVLKSKKIVLVSLLGAGQAFHTGMWRNLLPWATAGWMGVRRDEKTHKATLNYNRLPEDMSEYLVLAVDPMLATGGSASMSIGFMKDQFGAKNIRLINLVSAPEGVERVGADHPDVMVYSTALDSGLTKDAYITPGLGDAGDRYSGISPR